MQKKRRRSYCIQKFMLRTSWEYWECGHTHKHIPQLYRWHVVFLVPDTSHPLLLWQNGLPRWTVNQRLGTGPGPLQNKIRWCVCCVVKTWKPPALISLALSFTGSLYHLDKCVCQISNYKSMEWKSSCSPRLSPPFLNKAAGRDTTIPSGNQVSSEVCHRRGATFPEAFLSLSSLN